MNSGSCRGFVAAAILCLSNMSAYAAAPVDACSLLTPAQAGAVLGAAVGGGKQIATTVCEWAVSNELPGTTQKKVTVTLLTARGFEAATTPVGGLITRRAVHGIGDEAAFGTTGKVAVTLAVKKGSVMFSVRVQGFPLDQAQAVDHVQAKEKTLALQIVSKL